jgi:hypothetical protein
LKPEQVETFVAAETKISEAVRKTGQPGPIRWYQLVSGGETPQFLMVTDRENWAAYERSFEEEINGLMEKVYGKDQAASILREARSAVRSQYIETWQYRADLSFVPGGKQ